MLYDVENGNMVNTGIITDKNEYDPEIAWSDNPSKLFLKNGRIVETITFDGNMAATRVQTVSNSPLSQVYGRFDSGQWWGDDDWDGSFFHDKAAGMEAFAMPGLGAHLRIEVDGKAFILADNPGFLKLGDRGFADVCFLENGKELLFDDHHDIYLMDVNQRKVGRITDGSKLMMLTNRYRRDIWDTNKAK